MLLSHSSKAFVQLFFSFVSSVEVWTERMKFCPHSRTSILRSWSRNSTLAIVVWKCINQLPFIFFWFSRNSTCKTIVSFPSDVQVISFFNHMWRLVERITGFLSDIFIFIRTQFIDTGTSWNLKHFMSKLSLSFEMRTSEIQNIQYIFLNWSVFKNSVCWSPYLSSFC